MQAQKTNYQKELEKILADIKACGRVPSLLLHSCCAPCSSYVLEYLSDYFDITVFYFNPNITSRSEYEARVGEQKRLIAQMELSRPVHFLEGLYAPERFFDHVRGHEEDREGQERCFLCYGMRLEETARTAKEGGYDFFCTTLSISPLKNAQKLNEIGAALSARYGLPYLFSDFKKKNGYKRSIELSALYGLYRQDYCGCIFSKREREKNRL